MARLGVKAKQVVKKTPEQQVAALQEKAEQIRFKGMLSDVTTALKANPQFLPNILDLLRKLGVRACGHVADAPNLGAGMALCEGRADRSPHASGTSPAASVASSPRADRESFEDDVDVCMARVIPRCYTQVGAVPPNYLITVLARVENVSLPEAALRGHAKKGSRHIINEDLLCVLELIGNISPDADLPLKFHDCDIFVEALCHFNVMRGRVARELQLPPIWEECGVFRLLAEGDKQVSLLHKIMKKVVPLPESFLKRLGSCSSLVIEKDWSERQANVREVGGFARLTCILLFAGEASEENAFSASWRSAEEDGGVAVPCEEVVADASGPHAAGKVPCAGGTPTLGATGELAKVAGVAEGAAPLRIQVKQRIVSDADPEPPPPKKLFG